MTTRAAKLLVFALMMSVCIGCDRVTKRAAIDGLRDADPVSLAGGAVRLEYAENTGAFLGLAGGLAPGMRFLLLTALTSVLLAGIAFHLLRKQDLQWGRFLALSLILAGGVGNLIDRVSAGYVVDFVSIGLGSVRTGIFNVADLAITTGVLWLFVASFSRQKTVPARA